MIDSEVERLLKRAIDLHGHLGPFLVIGVKMGLIGKRYFGFEGGSKSGLQVVVRTHLFPPFSCVIDGIQAATSCTVGNRRLTVEESAREVSAYFRCPHSDKMLKVSVRREALDRLEKQLANNVDIEDLARAALGISDNELFEAE